MKALNMTQETLANKMGITRGAIGHYLSGRRSPPMEHFKKLAHVLKTDPAWLQYGLSVMTPTTVTPSKKTDRVNYPLPLLSWNDIKKRIDKNKKNKAAKEWIPHFFTDQPHWYALQVKGDAMQTPTGHQACFHDGDIIIVDPTQQAAHGSYVIAMLPHTKSATFKQYVIDGGVAYLKPLNPQYPTIKINNTASIRGVVIQCLKHLS
jgi:SOS-response transcriptional repressor LexA